MTVKSYCYLVSMTAGLLLLTLLPATGTGLPIVVSIEARNKQLEAVMTQIAAQTGLSFHYDKTELSQRLKTKVTLRCHKTPIEDVLHLLATQTGLKFLLKEDKIIVGPEPPAVADSVALLKGGPLPEKEIHGRVLNPKGQPLGGATILVRNSTRGTQTDTDGAFSIKGHPVDVLVFRSIGHLQKEVMIGDQDELNITLQESIKGLNEFVVAALGISRKSKELTYATQQLSNEDLTRVKDANVINSLSGRIAGVNIYRSASGIGGSARVILRGNKSTRENQPLYVIDGVPMANYTPSQPSNIWGESSSIVGNSGRDGGDGISNLNPDDIESINVLKGASAAALYGSQAANGVIIITTKRGRPGKWRVNVSSDLTVETPLILPKLQYRYGQTTRPYTDDDSHPQPGSADSWGTPLSATDHVRHFFNTGLTSANSISFSGGKENAPSYFSYSNTMNGGITPRNNFYRHTFYYRGSLRLLDNRLQIDGNFTFVAQKALNRPSSGLYSNPLTGLYNFPRGLNFNTYKQYEYFDATRQLPLQNWWNIHNDLAWTGQDDQQNPYWLLYRCLREEHRNRGLGSLSVKYVFNDWLSIQARGSMDRSRDRFEIKAFAGTQNILSPPNGRYTLEQETSTQLYADLLLSAVKKLPGRLQLSASLGTSITDVRAHDRTLISTNTNADPGLTIPNIFTADNIANDALDSQRYVERKQLQAVFANAQLGYRDYLFLDLTGRNDWSSTFAYTPIAGRGYFYYSSGLTALLSEMVKLPAAVNFAKLRVSYARVGNDIAPYVSRPSSFKLQTLAGTPMVAINNRSPYPRPGIYLKPEDNRSLEAGAEIRMLDNRVSLDFTWYRNNNYRQYMEVQAPSGSGSLFYYLNLGNIQNKGVEATLTLVPVRSKEFRWQSSFNYSFNKNRVVQLSDPDIPGAGPENSFVLTDFLTNMYGSFIKEGGSWGDIYTNEELYKNGKGQYVIDNDGYLKTNKEVKNIGNPNPRFTLGWNNTLDYKGFTLSFLVDGKFGGKVMSITQAILDEYGVSETSARARDNGGVTLNAVYEDGTPFTGKYDAQKYYTTIGGRAGIGEMYMYDATNIRLREMSLTWQLPIRSKWIKNLQVGLTGRNLCFFTLRAPFDPEVSMSSGNGLQGIDVYGQPAVRSMGVNLRVGF
ncbi:SusC/RagA family TonB-linked outer membrane protein [Chitinophaga agrisoli]|uniref:SusC/RagA family TonB-linked outer membrane protein n=1 Tax=Chitinophaga agrisoli TaxID=2607653 RepID=A0A5B2VUD0_9BACT|nr:SusC/RagA family TonB-linked outer membrane protein [Chitinophaga agrisoli]KAA2241836.1 SusC/RagA family TonB-linked outer membrane protein [Chitinophaga agrisoli]